MENRIFTTIIAAAMSAMIVLPSCNKDDNEIKLTHKDSAKVLEVLTKSQYAVGGNFSPNNGAKDIYVGTDFSIKPGVALNTPFEVKLADQTVTYRYDLKSCTITDASGADFATDYNYSEQDTLITINSKILNGNTKYTLSSTIALMQQINGEWQPVVYNGDAKEYVSTSLFTTCQAADTLRPADILFSYPIDRQLNYMPKEYQEGYIMLSYKYPELFDGVAAEDMKVVIKNISDETKVEQIIPFTVKESHEVDNEVVGIDYSLKDIMFDPEQIYSFKFYCGDKQVHKIYLRTSKYPNLKSKLAAENWFDNSVIVSSSDALCKDMTQNVFMDEGFDIIEYCWCGSYMPQSKDGNLDNCLIYVTADLDNCEWYQNSIFKSLYENYELDYDHSNRSVGYPPVDAYLFFNYKADMYLTDDDILNNNTKGKSHSGIFSSKLVWFMDRDVRARKNLIREISTDLDRKIKDYYEPPYYTSGEYPYFISFRIPGKNIITYSERHVQNYIK